MGNHKRCNGFGCIATKLEIEKVLGGVQSSSKSDSGTTAAMFGYLLTWMQESKKPKYICATANDMGDLMAISQGALLRRFDDIFFVDLPSQSERIEVLKIMNRRYKTNISSDYVNRMDGWTGAEIEKFTIASIYDGIEDAFVNIKPVYHQNREAIEKARDWSKSNARAANSDGPLVAKTTKRKLTRKEE